MLSSACYQLRAASLMRPSAKTLCLSKNFTRHIHSHGSPVYASLRPFSPQELDDKWLKVWRDTPSRFAKDVPTKDQDKSYFALSMIPYPSGNLHIGHLRVYTISDVLARYRRMDGYKVVHAMGWDAFGLPAENAAIERNIDASVWTEANIAKMKEQMNLMFAEFDWEREFVSCSPDYYKWTQKLFLMLHEKGLAYRKEALVNWDPIEKTVLANEQVDAEGKSWRSGALVEKKMLKQWFLGITEYASPLLEDLNILDQWPARVKTMQKNWIGKSEGAKIYFPVGEGHASNSLVTFTTRPDTLFGLQYVAISLNHPITLEFAKKIPKLDNFINIAKDLPEDTKAGFKLPNFYLANPLTPEKFDVPVFVAPYVIGDYGHGTVMGCPGHDTRDFGFWTANMPDQPVKVVITPPEKHDQSDEIYTGKDGLLNSTCGPFSGLSSKDGGQKIVEHLKEKHLGDFDIQWRLRDWLISRQRFWGAPIPIIHCDSCGTVPVPDEDLPVVLPKGLNAPLAVSEEFSHTICPSCGGEATRDTDTMDTFMDSSWYFFRYSDPKNEKAIFSYESASDLMPVDLYIGGIEHAILHLLYSRFIAKFLQANSNWSGGDLNGEPIRRLVTQGMVHGKTFNDPDTNKFLMPDEVDKSNPDKPIVKRTQKEAVVTYEKMSKSKYNGANPEECIQRHGADATRAHILFQAPVEDVLNWDESKITGVKRWLSKVKSYAETLSDQLEISAKENKLITIIQSSKSQEIKNLSGQERKLWIEVQKFIASITTSFHDDLSLNTVISDYMKLTNSIINTKNISLPLALYSYERLLKLMAPVVPATSEECWELIQASLGAVQSSGNYQWSSIFKEDWPHAEKIPVELGRFSIIINGKRRFVLNAPKELVGKSDELRELLTKSPEYDEWLAGKTITSFVVPPKGFAVTIATE